MQNQKAKTKAVKYVQAILEVDHDFPNVVRALQRHLSRLEELPLDIYTEELVRDVKSDLRRIYWGLPDDCYIKECDLVDPAIDNTSPLICRFNGAGYELGRLMNTLIRCLVLMDSASKMIRTDYSKLEADNNADICRRERIRYESAFKEKYLKNATLVDIGKAKGIIRNCLGLVSDFSERVGFSTIYNYEEMLAYNAAVPSEQFKSASAIPGTGVMNVDPDLHDLERVPHFAINREKQIRQNAANSHWPVCQIKTLGIKFNELNGIGLPEKTILPAVVSAPLYLDAMKIK